MYGLFCSAASPAPPVFFRGRCKMDATSGTLGCGKCHGLTQTKIIPMSATHTWHSHTEELIKLLGINWEKEFGIESW